MKKLLLVATGLCLPAQAFAQDTIVVTARKIEENIANTPVSVVYYSEQDLKAVGAEELNDIPHLGFRPVPQNASGSIFSMRGQTQNDVSITVDPSVATYIDNNYIGRGYGLNGPLIDISNVQVLKGPQGVLFGRNSTGGAVLINTNSPDLTNTSSTTEYSFGRFDEHRVNTVLNLPVSNNFGIRLAGAYDTSDGFSTNIDGQKYNSREDAYVRGKALVQFDNSNYVEITGDYYNSDTTAGPRMMLYGYGRLAGLQNANFSDKTYLNSGLVNDTETGSIYGTAKLGSFTFNGGWRRTEVIYAGDFDGTTQSIYFLDNRVSIDQYTFEGTKRGSLGSLDYTVGGLFFQEKGSEYGFASYYGGFSNTLQGGVVNNKSYGLFGSVIYPISDSLNINGGIRYTRDSKNLVSNNGAVGFNRSYLSCFSQEVSLANNCALSQSDTFNKVSWSIGADYTFAPSNMVYARVSTGYKSGGNQIRAVASNNDRISFDPEDIIEYELGVKGSHSVFSYNISAFYNETSNLQVLSVVTTPVVYTLVTNAAKTRSYGLEADIRIKVTNNLSLNGYGALIRPKYLSYVDPVSGRDLTSNRFNNVTRNQFSVGANYSRSNITATVNYTWYDKTDKLSTPLSSLVARYGATEGTKIYNTTVVPAYGIMNARLSYNISDSYTVSVWGRNILNERVFVDMVPLEGLFNASTLNEPATYGVSVRIKL